MELPREEEREVAVALLAAARKKPGRERERREDRGRGISQRTERVEAGTGGAVVIVSSLARPLLGAGLRIRLPCVSIRKIGRLGCAVEFRGLLR
jgi:hypothetical protein